MLDPRLTAGMVGWLTALAPDLGDRVQPFAAAPPDAAPYLTYAGVSHRPVGSLDGNSGLTVARVQLDVWDTDHLRGGTIAWKIVGTRDAPGLDSFRGWLEYPAIGSIPAGTLALQCVRLVGDPQQSAEPPFDGSEEWWGRTMLEFEITYVEG